MELNEESTTYTNFSKSLNYAYKISVLLTIFMVFKADDLIIIGFFY